MYTGHVTLQCMKCVAKLFTRPEGYTRLFHHFGGGGRGTGSGQSIQLYRQYSNMGMYGYIWVCMGMYGYVWVCMGIYGYIKGFEWMTNVEISKYSELPSFLT